MNLLEWLLAYAESHPRRVYAVAAAMAALIAWVDSWVEPSVSLGFLHILPILLAASTLRFPVVLLWAVVCSLLRELCGPFEGSPGAVWRLLIGFAGFTLAGFFVSELGRKRRLILEHLKEREQQMLLRRDAEQQVRVLVETSPLAILTLDGAGKVLLANEAARELLALRGRALEGVDAGAYLPILRHLPGQPAGAFRTTIECKGQRDNGEVFLAHMWVARYETALGARLAAVVWDASENLRDREGAGLDSMMDTSRVLIGAVTHEVRNLATAAAVAYDGLRTAHGVERAEPFQALGSIIAGLQSLASTGLRLASDRTNAVTDLGTVLDEARIVIEPLISEEGGAVRWRIAEGLPLVFADHHSLLQVFINLARNSQQAIRGSYERELEVSAALEGESVVVRFHDTGCGVTDPEGLFRPFQPGARATGLGLYVSRIIVRAHGGDLRYEPRTAGSTFAVEMRSAGAEV